MKKLKMLFDKIILLLNLESGLRVSFWNEEDDQYLMPCEFVSIIPDGERFIVEIYALDPLNRISNISIDHNFLFGHPGKIIGRGILIEMC